MPGSVRPLIAVAIAAALAGCGDEARRHQVDSVYLDAAQEKDVFVASTPALGPDTDVVVLAEAPKARYQNGAIVLTGGRELAVVQPHAWRVYTGTAISTEEARRMIDRAERLDQALRDVGAAADELRRSLASRGKDARKAGALREREERHQRERAAADDRQRDAESAAVTAARDRELEALDRERDAALAAVDGTAAKAQRRVDADYAARRASQADEARCAGEDLIRHQRMIAAAAQDSGKDAGWLAELDRRHAAERAEAAESATRAASAVECERERDLAKLRAEAESAAARLRLLHDEQAERVRRTRAGQVAEISADRAAAGRRGAAAATGDAAPAAVETAGAAPAAGATP